MSVQFVSVTFDALDPPALARFWADFLGWEVGDETDDWIEVRPTDDTGFDLQFIPTEEPKSRKNPFHFDLTSATPDGQQQTVARAIELGARHLDLGQRPEEGHVVLADPEGNEFCIIEAGNKFLAECGFLGAVSCEGTAQVGYFWRDALGWPLVWDQDEETAIRSPHGGPKITWGGWKYREKAGKNRLHFDLAPPAGGDQAAEVERLIGLGATRVDIGQGDVSWVVLADPDGNEFCVLSPR